MKVKNTHVMGHNIPTPNILIIYELEDGSYVMTSNLNGIRVIDKSEFLHWKDKMDKTDEYYNK